MKRFIAILIFFVLLAAGRVAFADSTPFQLSSDGTIQFYITDMTTTHGIMGFSFATGTYPVRNGVGSYSGGPSNAEDFFDGISSCSWSGHFVTCNLETVFGVNIADDAEYSFSVYAVDGVLTWEEFIYPAYKVGGVWVPYGDLGETQFYSYELSTTTQTFHVTGYISPDDLNVHLLFNVSTPVYAQWDHEDVTATTTGMFDYSFIYQNFSTSTMDIFTFTSQLYTPSTDPFTGLTPPTIYDEVSTTTNANGIGVTQLPTPAEIDLAIAENCNPFSSFWSVATCASYLFFPNPTAAANNVAILRDTLLTKFPLGYITRMYDIITAEGTTTIPALSYTWPSDGGPLSGATWTIDVDNYMAQAKTLTDEMVSTNDDPKNVWEIMMPFVNIFLALYVLYNILHDIIGIDLMNKKRGQIQETQ